MLLCLPHPVVTNTPNCISVAPLPIRPTASVRPTQLLLIRLTISVPPLPVIATTPNSICASTPSCCYYAYQYLCLKHLDVANTFISIFAPHIRLMPLRLTISVAHTPAYCHYAYQYLSIPHPRVTITSYSISAPSSAGGSQSYSCMMIPAYQALLR